MAPRHHGVRADLHQRISVLRECGLTGSRLVVDQPKIEHAVRRKQLNGGPHGTCRQINRDPSAGVHGLAAHPAKIGERQNHDVRWRADGCKRVESRHERGRVRHSGVGRIAACTDRHERDAANTATHIALVHVIAELMTNLRGETLRRQVRSRVSATCRGTCLPITKIATDAPSRAPPACDWNGAATIP